MQQPPTARDRFARILNEEFKRVARRDEIPMEELVNEVSLLIQRSVRHVYNYRTGKWPFEPALIPIFCRRFGSRALLDAVVSECSEVTIEVPDKFDLTRMVSMTVRQDLQFYEEFLNAFEGDGIEPEGLRHLRELMERVVHNAFQFLEIASMDCERRHSHRAALRSIQRSSTDHSKDHSFRSTDREQTREGQTVTSTRHV